MILHIALAVLGVCTVIMFTHGPEEFPEWFVRLLAFLTVISAVTIILTIMVYFADILGGHLQGD